MVDLRHTLHSQGNLEVSSTFGKFVVDDSVWQSMSAEDKDAHVASFLAYRPRQATTSTTVTSMIERRADFAVTDWTSDSCVSIIFYVYLCQ